MSIARKIDDEQLSFDVESSKMHIKEMHDKNKGWITLAKKNPDYLQWHYKYNDIENKEEEILNCINSYISQNTFYKPQRRIENIKELRALYIDLDCYKTKYTKDAVKYFLENDFYGTKIPRPNFLIDSGQGLYYIILIKPVPHMALPLWYAVQRHLYNQLKEFGADAKALDPTRVLRVAGTINSKTNTKVKIIDQYDYEYTLRELQEEYLPEIKPKEKNKKAGRPKKVVSLFNEYSLYHARILDLIKICELRNWDLVGFRETILFLYRYWTCYFTEDTVEALERAVELNNKFSVPLTEKEVERDTKSAERAFLNENKEYRYSNEKLIEILEITSEEQKYLKTIIGTREKYDRNNEKRKIARKNRKELTKREKDKLDKINKVKEMYKKGMTQTEIAKNLGITTRYVKQILAEENKST